MTTVNKHGELMRAMAAAQARVQDYAARETSAAIVGVVAAEAAAAEADLLGTATWQVIHRSDDEADALIVGEVDDRRSRVERLRVVHRFAQVFGGRVKVIGFNELEDEDRWDEDSAITVETAVDIAGVPAVVCMTWWKSGDGERPGFHQVMNEVETRTEAFDTAELEGDADDDIPLYDINEKFD